MLFRSKNQQTGQETVNVKSGLQSISNSAFSIFKETFDQKNGGFGIAPKFPSAHNILFLILYAAQNKNSLAFEMAAKTLIQMRKGGIFDHIGYGFSRYSTDKYFLVPHFEKMLYDNAMLIMAYLAAYSFLENGSACINGSIKENITKEARDKEIFLDTAIKTADYVLREMASSDGGFYSAQDADSKGTEGKFYTWSLDEIKEILGGKKGEEFAKAFDITAGGNFEGENIPNLLKNNINNNFSEEIKKLYNYRKKRTSLHLDDKHLVSWNSMMITALAMLYRVSKNQKYLDAALKADLFIEKNLYNGTGLYTSCRNGRCSGSGFLNDYAFYTTALIEIYNSTLDKKYLSKAEHFCNEAVKRFSYGGKDGYFLNEPGNNELFINPKEIYDGAMPCANSVMAYNLVRLFQITQNETYKNLTDKQLSFMAPEASKNPAGDRKSVV